MWMTINKIVDGKCVKYDTYETEAEADARIIEVRVNLEPSSAALVNRLTGMKVIAKFQPL